MIARSLAAIAAMILNTATSACSLQLIEKGVLSVRNAHSMIYDTDRKGIYLFGGADATSVRGDTWCWNSEKGAWQFVTASGPSPRTFAAFAYDELHHEGILFGGNRVLFGKGSEKNSFLADTWRFRNNQWTRITADGPQARAEAAVAYDRMRGRIVLYGGYRRTSGATERFGDTWEWNGRRWTRVATDGPSPRNGAAMAYDAHLHEVILFGGPGPSDETWAWNGHFWRRLDSGNVPGRYNAVMVYDDRLRTVLRFGGWTGRSRAGDTWVLGPKGWQLLASEGPLARNHSAIVYDRVRGEAIMFGGHDGQHVLGDTWQWNGSTWSLLSAVPPETFIDNGH